MTGLTEHLAQLIGYVPLAVAVLSSDARYVYVNRRLAVALGRPAAELVGRSVRELAPTQAPDIEALVSKVVGGGEPVVDVEVSGRGDTRWQVSGYPLRDAGGLTQVALVALDVTELVATRDALARSEARSLALQRAAVPARTPVSAELEIAVRRVPGAAGQGGWYDVIELGAGRLGVALGEVSGGGTQAAAVTAQLRTAVRTCARRDMRPVDVVDLLDSLVAGLADRPAATCMYGVFDPYLRELQLASAGQLPPVLRSPAGGAQVVSVEATSPLGAGDAARATAVPLAAGAILALYTGGLVRGRGRGADTGVLALAAALVNGPPALGSLADAVLSDLTDSGSEGEVLLLLRVPDDIADRSRAVALPVPRDRGRTGEVRDLVRGAGQQWTLLPEVTDLAVLLASELVTNSLVHGLGRIEVRLRLTRDRLVVEVSDESRQLPRRDGAEEQHQRGRGLHLVSMLAHRWGARPTDDGKVVWAELDLAAT